MEPTSIRTHGRVLVVMPAWNEEASVATTVAGIRATDPGIDVLVVDDGSTDRTAERANQAGALVCRLPFNLGVGGAMRTGYRYALRHGYDVAVQIDADGQHDPAYLAALLDRLDSAGGATEGADIVVGARFAGEGDYRVGLLRGAAMNLLARTLTRMAHTRLTDVTSGFRAANRRGIEVFAEHYPVEYLGDTVESLVIAMRGGCTVTQVPVSMQPRRAGAPSQSSVRAAVYLARAVVALSLSLVRRIPLTAHDALALEARP